MIFIIIFFYNVLKNIKWFIVQTYETNKRPNLYYNETN